MPGGGLEFGESPEDAPRRELREEIGLDIDRADLATVLSHRVTYTRPDGVTVDFRHIGILYRVTFAAPPTLETASPDERATSFPLSDISTLFLTPFTRTWLEDMT